METKTFTGFRQIFTFAFITVFTFASTVPAQKIRSNGSTGNGNVVNVLGKLEGGGVVVDGNPNCATLNAMDSEFPTITEDWGLKLDFNPPSGMSGPYPFTNGSGRELTGGAPAEPENSVAINRDGNMFDFTATRSISAVIVKGGPDGNVYVYPVGTFADQDLLTPADGRFGISHIEFCYELTASATAAPVELGGRITTAVGRAIAGAEVTVTDMTTGESRVTRTNTFGYYRFDNIEITAFYSLSVSSKRYVFRNGTQYFTLSDSNFDMNFVSSN